mmetsp:Transcript_55019/g.130598  ORF Transcript_55019/g.130598 Transcript_55019/m.130598 type:complete len:340 (+) Transcript_55019:83-1102(+)
MHRVSSLVHSLVCQRGTRHDGVFQGGLHGDCGGDHDVPAMFSRHVDVRVAGNVPGRVPCGRVLGGIRTWGARRSRRAEWERALDDALAVAASDAGVARHGCCNGWQRRGAEGGSGRSHRDDEHAKRRQQDLDHGVGARGGAGGVRARGACGGARRQRQDCHPDTRVGARPRMGGARRSPDPRQGRHRRVGDSPPSLHLQLCRGDRGGRERRAADGGRDDGGEADAADGRGWGGAAVPGGRGGLDLHARPRAGGLGGDRVRQVPRLRRGGGCGAVRDVPRQHLPLREPRGRHAPHAQPRVPPRQQLAAPLQPQLARRLREPGAAARRGGPHGRRVRGPAG